MKLLKTVCLLFITFLLLTSCKSENKNEVAVVDTANIYIKGTMDAELTSPPYVPAPVGDRRAKRLLVNMEILEKEGTMTDGVRYMYWTF